MLSFAFSNNPNLLTQFFPSKKNKKRNETPAQRNQCRSPAKFRYRKDCLYCFDPSLCQDFTTTIELACFRECSGPPASLCPQFVESRLPRTTTKILSSTSVDQNCIPFADRSNSRTTIDMDNYCASSSSSLSSSTASSWLDKFAELVLADLESEPKKDGILDFDSRQEVNTFEHHNSENEPNNVHFSFEFHDLLNTLPSTKYEQSSCGIQDQIQSRNHGVQNIQNLCNGKTTERVYAWTPLRTITSTDQLELCTQFAYGSGSLISYPSK
ncbi:uncharacterized protein V1516DRAFT_663575 [Lipomyces oligophaga]|uniref:uncharacterized protein n=1 Tax=Lipomyces oligophaga TaxID=45792 RepID=UPI0034CDF94D